MPYARPTLTALRAQVAQHIAAQLSGTDPLLRFSNLGILSTALAGLAHQHFGYLDWIAKQCNPFTCTGEFLEAWAALKGINRTQAGLAAGVVAFTGTDGTLIPSGSSVTRGDGRAYITTADATVAHGVAAAHVIAVADPTGLTGAAWNADAGTSFALASALAGIGAGAAQGAITGGSDLEADDTLRTRMLVAYRTVSHGGSSSDYLAWALAVPGVTRAWCVPHGYGPGSVLVYTMRDGVAGHGGFPQGINGTASGERRDVAASGDMLAVADAIFPVQPVTALVYAMAPSSYAVAVTVTGLQGASAATKAAVTAALSSVFAAVGRIDAGTTTVNLLLLNAALSGTPNTAGAVIVQPSANIVVPAGSLPVLGAITWG